MSDQLSISVEGGSAFRAAISARKIGLDRAARRGVSEGMTIVHREIADQLRLTSHPVGTITPSSPGEPPSLITGNLMRSIEEYGPYYDGPHEAVGLVGPTAVQARIQELGGDTGRNHATHLPARPYVHPAVEIAGPKVSDKFAEVFAEELRG